MSELNYYDKLKLSMLEEEILDIIRDLDNLHINNDKFKPVRDKLLKILKYLRDNSL